MSGTTKTSRRYWMLALLPPLALLLFVWLYHVDVPYWDDWEFAPVLAKYYEGHLTFADLWARTGLYRLIVRNVVLLELNLWSHWQIAYETVAKLIVAFSFFGVLVCLIRRTFRLSQADLAPWLLPVISLLVFSLSQRDAWFLGTHIVFFLVVLFTTIGISILSRRELTSAQLAMAAAAGVLCTFSFGNGILYWPIGLALLVFHADGLNKRHIILWSIVMFVVLGLDLYDFRLSDLSVEHVESGVSEPPLARIFYPFINLGAPLFPYSRKAAFLSGICGLAGTSWMIWFLLKRRRMQMDILLPYLALDAYVLASTGMNFIARSNFGTYFALRSRYIVITQLFWISLAVFVALAAKTNTGTDDELRTIARRKIYSRAALLLTVLILIGGSCYGAGEWLKLRSQLTAARDELVLGKEGKAWESLYPHKDILREWTALIRHYRLSVFREDAPADKR